MLRIAVPNKGSLSEVAAEMLAEAGYSGRRDSRKLVHTDSRNGVEFFYLRPRDIATYVGSGALHVGITGRDLLLDSGSDAVEIAALDFADSTFRFAAPAGGDISDIAHLAGKRVATSYPKLVDDFLRERGVEATLVKLDGAVESAVQLGVADAVADVVSTGATLRAAGLDIFGPVILDSTALLIGGPTAHAGTDRLLRRLRGVLVARKYAILEYDLPIARLEAATEIASGIESPTVSPLKEDGWVAVRVMVLRDDANDVMDRLYDVGAKGIFVTQVHAARF
ncbi:ATP phosphoribosyltransferase [Leucobacter triazinivorans]|uniref:ATP phosphoribosyltransferase n=1 Tax=Leucobacter triazinivorans TaxID=1784719 RepID=A0A4P6KIM6_9MICO|nr:ATP phosphoribosyltransferase [Leucobacter triazinivorans]QBE49951.1 ATP phosphoribosyltransferase [Leucobacter triazinivorans]